MGPGSVKTEGRTEAKNDVGGGMTGTTKVRTGNVR